MSAAHACLLTRAMPLVLLGCAALQSMAQDTIRVGILFSMSGQMAPYEAGLAEITAMAIEEINARGGVNGRRLEAVIRDGASTPPLFAERARELLQRERVPVIFGGWMRSAALAMKPEVDRAGGLLFYPAPFSDSLISSIGPSNSIIMTGGPSRARIAALAAFLTRPPRSYERWHVVGDGPLAEIAREELARSGIAANRIRIHALSQGRLRDGAGDDIRRDLGSAKALILSTVDAAATAGLARVVAGGGSGSQRFDVVSLHLEELLLGQLEPSAVEGQLTASSYFMTLNSAENREFKNRWSAYARRRGLAGIGDAPAINADMKAAYTGVYLWAEAARVARSTEPREVARALPQVRFRSVDGSEVAMEAGGTRLRVPLYVAEARRDRTFSILWASIAPRPATSSAWARPEGPPRPTGGTVRAGVRGSDQRTISGPAAGGAVNAAYGAGGSPPSGDRGPGSSRREGGNPPSGEQFSAARQAACDSALESGEKAFNAWRTQNRTALPDWLLSLEKFAPWYRDATPELKSSAKPINEAVRSAMSNCFTSATPGGFPTSLSARIGGLSGPEGKRSCTATQISATTILTAKHCIELSSTDPAEPTVFATEAQLTTFRFHLQGRAPLRVEGLASPINMSLDLPNDWVTLRVGALPAADRPNLPTAPTKIPAGTPLVVAGLMIISDDDAPSFAAQFTAGQSCRALYATENCLMHTCNTVPGMSGAPIFSLLDGEWRLVGMHVKAATTDNHSHPKCKHFASDSVKGQPSNGGIYAPSIVR